MTERPFPDHRQAALALLSGNHRLSRKAGQFLGQLAVDPSPMSEAQADWLAKLLDRNGLATSGKGRRAMSTYPDAPGHRNVETSIAAADALVPRLGRLQRLSDDAIRDAGCALVLPPMNWRPSSVWTAGRSSRAPAN